MLCTVNDAAPRLIQKQGLIHIPVKYVIGWRDHECWCPLLFALELLAEFSPHGRSSSLLEFWFGP